MADEISGVPITTHESNAAELVRSLIVVTALSVVFMSLRFYCKTRYSKNFGIDDGLLAFSWVCLLCYVVLVSMSTTYGLGTHFLEVDFNNMPRLNKFLFVGEFFGIIGIAIAKTSFCVTLLRLCTQMWHRVSVWVCIVTVNLVMWICALTFFIGCDPIEKKFDYSVQGTCWDTSWIVKFAVFAGAWSATTDFLLALFPWILIWNLQMKHVEKIGVCVCMSMGFLSGIMACVKSAFVLPSLSDYTFKSTPLLIWSATELSVIIMASSVPHLRLFLKEVHSKASNLRSRTGYMKDYNLDNFSSGQRTHTRTQVHAQPKAKFPDDASDRSFLADENTRYGILRTDEVRIERRVETDVERQI